MNTTSRVTETTSRVEKGSREGSIKRTARVAGVLYLVIFVLSPLGPISSTTRAFLPVFPAGVTMMAL